MQKKFEVDLINGEFSTEDARELLIDLFSRKTNFHEIKNFSANERFGKDDPIHMNRIDCLTNNIQKLNLLFRELSESDCRLVIKSDVTITVKPIA
jgi:uncharacterized protein with von Willebrand factor type A (vWA) domain